MFADTLNQFAYDLEHPSDSGADDHIPELFARISVFHSATAIFYAPSDICGIGGMRQEHIRATKSWYGTGPRYDCVFIVHDKEAAGMEGMDVARVLTFLSFEHEGKTYKVNVGKEAILSSRYVAFVSR